MSAKTMFLKTVLIVSATIGMTLGQQPDIGSPPGRLVEMDGRRIHFICNGSGSPTVLIEAGASSFAIDFSLVQPEISKTNRVCSYDRAGMGWSDPRGTFDTAQRIVEDLHSAIEATGEKPPFIMVGASAGGLYVRLYQLEHPKDVAGLVLLDPATEDRLFTFYQQRPVAIAELTAEQLRTTIPASGSLPIPTRVPQTGEPFARLPPPIYELRVNMDRRLIASLPSAVSAEIVQQTSEAQRAVLARLLKSRSEVNNPMRDIPVVVLTRGLGMSEGLAQNHAALAGLSNNSKHEVVSNSGHEIHLYAPARVIQAVNEVTLAIRQRTRLPK